MKLEYPLDFFLIQQESDLEKYLEVDTYPWPEERLKESFASCVLSVNSITKKAAILVFFETIFEAEPFQVMMTLVHESCHVFDYMMDYYGVKDVDGEIRAYGIEHIYAELWNDYSNRKKILEELNAN